MKDFLTLSGLHRVSLRLMRLGFMGPYLVG